MCKDMVPIPRKCEYILHLNLTKQLNFSLTQLSNVYFLHLDILQRSVSKPLDPYYRKIRTLEVG